MYRGRVGLFAFAALLAATFVRPAHAQLQEYHLDTQDKLMIRVVEWQTVEGTFRDWSAVTGEYTVSPAGTLSLPLVGELPARGQTTAEVAELIAKSLQEKLGLSDRPEASVELAEYRPFYISGDVRAPGQYPYAPNLTVLKAISVAGGSRRDGESTRLERDLLNAKGGYDVLADTRLRLLVKRARIEAEIGGKKEFEPPKGYESNPELAAVMADEQAIMTARQRTLSLRLEALEDLKQLLQSEISSLEQKVKTQKRQMELAKEELSGLGSLADRGLVVNTRVLSTERSIADMEGKLLDHETAILRAKQDISKASQEAIEISNNMSSDLAIERQQVEAELNQTVLKLGTQRGLISEALSLSGSTALGDEEIALSFAIVRQVDGKSQEIDASENTPVLPGDVLKVTRSLMNGQALPGQ
ncbi:polysaccharide biosynthesis/export family protein [Aquamicrobium sp. LC103]|uniref:polysaccharide biosynthesis/export family protein n=1 Tax=Aquamicrobium sp. LC103 TaxID=1120658 RepID=UPI00063E82A4|nr:polysaccharide biosynthesis/export family protein [Aquamicrobium sp. LC103]TKT69326.1 sugar ABC transporter substrate-binding protein [Aquamicrobium sp. LC103]